MIDRLETAILNKINHLDPDTIIQILDEFVINTNGVCMTLLKELEKCFLEGDITELTSKEVSILLKIWDMSDWNLPMLWNFLNVKFHENFQKRKFVGLEDEFMDWMLVLTKHSLMDNKLIQKFDATMANYLQTLDDTQEDPELNFKIKIKTIHQICTIFRLLEWNNGQWADIIGEFFSETLKATAEWLGKSKVEIDKTKHLTAEQTILTVLVTLGSIGGQNKVIIRFLIDLQITKIYSKIRNIKY